jgi:hypothetical protein
LLRGEIQVLIWLASYPRSGNTLVRLVLEREFGCHTCSVYREGDSGNVPQIADLVSLTSADLVAQAIDLDEDIHFVKTHEVAASDTFPAIYVVRDGRDATVSFAHFLIDFEIGHDERYPELHYWQTLQEIITNERYGGWSRNVQSWLHRPGTVVIKFEELIIQPVETVREALSRLPCEVPMRTGQGEGIAPFEQLHRNSPRLFRTGASGNWQTDMDDLLQELFWQHHGSTMDAFEYPRAASPALLRKPYDR